MAEIPDDVAKEAAVWHRTQAASVHTFDDAEWHRNLAYLLDPPADAVPRGGVVTSVEIDLQAIARAVDRGDPLTIFGKTYAPAADPQPPTLREQVAKAWCAEYYGEYSDSAKNPAPDHLDAADAVLAVVADAPIEQLIALVGPRFADWLAAQPVVPNCGSAVDGDGCFVKDQRDHDVRLLRGGSDG